MTTVITTDAITQTSAPAATNDLWMSAEEARKATGWTLKPEGFCKDEICVPTPADAGNYVRDNEVNVAGFWRHMGKPCVSSADGDVWMLGEGAAARNEALLSLEAPEFTLPDFDGKLHSITDFRRQRVLLITWASW